MTLTAADVSRDLTAYYVKQSPDLEGSLTVQFKPHAAHDWEVHGSCVSVTVVMRTSPFDPRFPSHVKRAYRAAVLIHREQTAAHTMRRSH